GTAVLRREFWLVLKMRECGCMPFNRRARSVGTALAGAYFVVGVLFFRFCGARPRRGGVEVVLPFFFDVSFSRRFRGRRPIGIILGLLFNTAVVFFIAAGLTTGISRN